VVFGIVAPDQAQHSNRWLLFWKRAGAPCYFAPEGFAKTRLAGWLVFFSQQL